MGSPDPQPRPRKHSIALRSIAGFLVADVLFVLWVILHQELGVRYSESTEWTLLGIMLWGLGLGLLALGSIFFLVLAKK